MTSHTYPAGKLPHEVLARLIRSYTHLHPDLVVPSGVGEDAAVIDLGDRYLVAKTDPITFASDAIGWYAVNVNANDIAAMGGRPRFFLSTILLPQEQATPALIESIFRSIHAAAGQLDIAVCGGHTEITAGIDRPIVVGQMLGEVEPGNLVRSSGLRPGDALLLTKGLAIEATAIIAREKRAELLRQGHAAGFLDLCSRYLENPGISVVRDAAIACRAGQVHAMHDPTEGGVATALSELATASDVGLEIDAHALRISPESARLCSAFDLDPLGVISSGALLIGCPEDSAPPVVAALEKEGIHACRIGTVRESRFGLQLRRDGRLNPLPQFAADEMTRLFPN